MQTYLVEFISCTYDYPEGKKPVRFVMLGEEPFKPNVPKIGTIVRKDGSSNLMTFLPRSIKKVRGEPEYILVLRNPARTHTITVSIKEQLHD